MAIACCCTHDDLAKRAGGECLDCGKALEHTFVVWEGKPGEAAVAFCPQCAVQVGLRLAKDGCEALARRDPVGYGLSRWQTSYGAIAKAVRGRTQLPSFVEYLAAILRGEAF